MTGYKATQAALELPGLEPLAKLTLAILASHVSPENGAEVWPSLATLSRMVGCSESHVRRALRKLEKAGLIHRRACDGSSNSYLLLGLSPVEGVSPVEGLGCHRRKGRGATRTRAPLPPVAPESIREQSTGANKGTPPQPPGGGRGGARAQRRRRVDNVSTDFSGWEK